MAKKTAKQAQEPMEDIEQPVERVAKQTEPKLQDHEKPWFSKHSHKAVRPANGGSLMSLYAGQDLSADFVLVQNLRAGGVELVNSLDECVFE